MRSPDVMKCDEMRSPGLNAAGPIDNNWGSIGEIFNPKSAPNVPKSPPIYTYIFICVPAVIKRTV